MLKIFGYSILWFIGMLLIPFIAVCVSCFIFKVNDKDIWNIVACFSFVIYWILTAIFLIIL